METKNEGQRGASNVDVGTGTQNDSQPLSKMTSGGQELRDHDFPVSQDQAHKQHGPVAIDTGAPPLESERSGGKVGTVAGDAQPLGQVGTIVNQDGLVPDHSVDR